MRFGIRGMTAARTARPRGSGAGQRGPPQATEPRYGAEPHVNYEVGSRQPWKH